MAENRVGRLEGEVKQPDFHGFGTTEGDEGDTRDACCNAYSF